MRYAFFNDGGRVESAHNDDTVVELPEGAIELTEEQFSDRFNLKLSKKKLTVSPVVATKPTVEQLAAEIDAKRASAYRLEADPLFFKSQRGECSREDWETKIAEIKARYPKE